MVCNDRERTTKVGDYALGMVIHRMLEGEHGGYVEASMMVARLLFSNLCERTSCKFGLVPHFRHSWVLPVWFPIF
jgi:hypothetical protein